MRPEWQLGEVKVGVGRGSEREAGNRLNKIKVCTKCQNDVFSLNARF